MGNIVLLDELTINKIAAGEVVERPASVIKEMIENSIDAGANNINIEIKNGGISYIRITDNGKGIVKDDMEMAFERHATSKIRSADDLNQVKSMGFRGEALASIASIANVEMISKTVEEQIGNKIVVEAGKVLLFEEAGCGVGTTITVQNLFFNTPVRYKFLKKDYTESGYIEDVVTRLALIHPEIAFRLINSGKTIIQTSGNNRIQDVIYAIYGSDIASSILDVDYIYEDVRITGVVGKPEIARSNRSNQLFFVNKRFVKDKTLSGATENSFKGLLPIGKYGFLILNIDMDPAKVDVNVHPAKLEVRFQEENKIFKAVYHAIKDTLLKAELIANTEKTVEDIEDVNKMHGEKEKTSIADLFKKITKTQEENNIKKISKIYEKKDEDINFNNIKQEKYNDEENSNNIIQEIFNKREENGIGSNSEIYSDLNKSNENEINPIQKLDYKTQHSKDNTNQTIYNEKNIEQNKQLEQFGFETSKKNLDNNTSSQDKKMDVFKELIAMQQQLKKEVENNPNIHTNIHSLIEDTEKLKNSENIKVNVNNDIVESNLYDKQESDLKEETTNIQNATKYDLPQISNSKDLMLKEEVIPYQVINGKILNEQNQNLSEDISNNIEQEIYSNMENSISKEKDVDENNVSTDIYANTQNNKNEEIHENIQSNINQVRYINKDNKNNDIQNTRIFTSAEIQEMMDKLEKIDNVDESPEFANMYEKIFGKPPASVENEKKKEQEKINAYELIKNNNISVFDTIPEYQEPVYKLIGIAFNTYIIIEIKDEIYIIDQHAAHERVMYEKVKQNYYSNEDKDSQMLLLPDIITLTHKEMDILNDNLDMFEKAGFSLEEFGENTIKLTGVPNICLELDTKELFLETLDEINQVARTAKQEIEERFIATVACKAAVKANMDLTNEEVDSLMNKLLKLPNPFTCPHGRPTAIKMDKNDIEKKFARRK